MDLINSIAIEPPSHSNTVAQGEIFSVNLRASVVQVFQIATHQTKKPASYKTRRAIRISQDVKNDC